MDGKDYHFSNLTEMEAMKEKGEFIETAHFSGNMYGTSIAAVKTVAENGK